MSLDNGSFREGFVGFIEGGWGVGMLLFEVELCCDKFDVSILNGNIFGEFDVEVVEFAIVGEDVRAIILDELDELIAFGVLVHYFFEKLAAEEAKHRLEVLRSVEFLTYCGEFAVLLLCEYFSNRNFFVKLRDF